MNCIAWLLLCVSARQHLRAEMCLCLAAALRSAASLCSEHAPLAQCCSKAYQSNLYSGRQPHHPGLHGTPAQVLCTTIGKKHTTLLHLAVEARDVRLVGQLLEMVRGWQLGRMSFVMPVLCDWHGRQELVSQLC